MSAKWVTPRRRAEPHSRHPRLRHDKRRLRPNGQPPGLRGSPRPGRPRVMVRRSPSIRHDRRRAGRAQARGPRRGCGRPRGLRAVCQRVQKPPLNCRRPKQAAGRRTEGWRVARRDGDLRELVLHIAHETGRGVAAASGNARSFGSASSGNLSEPTSGLKIKRIPFRVSPHSVVLRMALGRRPTSFPSPERRRTPPRVVAPLVPFILGRPPTGVAIANCSDHPVATGGWETGRPRHTDRRRLDKNAQGHSHSERKSDVFVGFPAII